MSRYGGTVRRSESQGREPVVKKESRKLLDFCLPEKVWRYLSNRLTAVRGILLTVVDGCGPSRPLSV